MKNLDKFATPVAAALIALIWNANYSPASAYRAIARGQYGAATAFANQGQYGSRIGARAVGRNAGAGLRAGQFAGPNGGSAQGASAFGYRRGVGAFRQGGWSGKGQNGTTASGSAKNQYNAQTGTGTRSSQMQAQNAAGQDYGYTGNTNYTKGQGSQSVIQTDNKGTYDVNLEKGEKPVVTTVPSSN
jgi:hypothetical protein